MKYIFIYLLISFCLLNCDQGTSKSEAGNYADEKTSGEELYLQKLVSNADTTHSSLQFRAKHSGVYDVIGWIAAFSIRMEGQRKDFKDVTVEAKADIRSVVMPNMGMAANLQGMFATERYPYVFFKSKSIDHIRGHRFRLLGDMTIKGITKEVPLAVQFNGFGSPLTFGVPGFTVDGEFSRFDFGIGEPEINEYVEGPPLIGDSIYFRANLRFFFEE